MPALLAARVLESPRLRPIAVARAMGGQLDGSAALLGSEALACAVQR
ncbi:MAG TPA: hypothetical protein VET87_16045 [Rubrivivax sp.]|nr:hypothetical protein [Rubrivivax sp.]